MSPRVSDNQIEEMEAATRLWLSASHAAQHRYADSMVIGICMDLRDARARIEVLEAALAEAGQALRDAHDLANKVGHAEMDLSCEPGCVACDLHDITVPVLNNPLIRNARESTLRGKAL